MAYQAVTEAREAAEKRAKDTNLAESVRLGLEMRRADDKRRADQDEARRLEAEAATSPEVTAIDQEIEALNGKIRDLQTRRRQAIDARLAAILPEDLTGRIRALILSKDPAQLKWVEAWQFANMIGLEGRQGEHLVDAITELENSEPPILKRFWFLVTDGDDTMELEGEDIAAWKAGGPLIDPQSGEEIPDPATVVRFAWEALPRA